MGGESGAVDVRVLHLWACWHASVSAWLFAKNALGLLKRTVQQVTMPLHCNLCCTRSTLCTDFACTPQQHWSGACTHTTPLLLQCRLSFNDHTVLHTTIMHVQVLPGDPCRSDPGARGLHQGSGHGPRCHRAEQEGGRLGSCGPLAQSKGAC